MTNAADVAAGKVLHDVPVGAGALDQVELRRWPADAGVIVLLYRPMSGRELLASLNGTQDHPVKWDARLFGVGAQILRALNVGKMRLLASPRKIPNMAGFGLEVTGYFTPAGEKTA